MDHLLIAEVDVAVAVRMAGGEGSGVYLAPVQVEGDRVAVGQYGQRILRRLRREADPDLIPSENQYTHAAHVFVAARVVPMNVSIDQEPDFRV
jgi:hypothetical protein